MDNNVKRRITMKLKHPNPLFEKWLTDWRDKAKERDSKMQYTFSKALESLRKYPLPLESGRDCKILQGFGDKLCQILDEKLQEHRKVKPDCDVLQQCQSEVSVGGKEKARRVRKASPKSKSDTNSNKREYSPAYRSGGYAMLIALYANSLQPDFKGFMTKDEIIRDGQYLCQKSFTKPDPGTFYTSWSSMGTLVNKNLVAKAGNPATFSLTDAGLVVAHKLYRTNLSDDRESEQIEGKIAGNSQQDRCSSEDAMRFSNSQVAGSSKSSDTGESYENYNLDGIIDIGEPLNIDINSLHEPKKPNVAVTGEKGNKKKVPQIPEEKCTTPLDSGVETVIFAPNNFDIYLIVDTQETGGSSLQTYDDPILAELAHMKVPFEVKHLKVGDYVWICRDRVSKIELVLPYIVERKRMDDFGSSIKDGRYHEQKFRLKQCGIQNVVYLVESYGDNMHTGLPLTTLLQAATNTSLHDNFQVKFTDDLRGTALYLSCMTKILESKYKMKTVMSCPRNNLEKCSIEDDLVPLMSFKEFNQSGSMHKKFTARQMFLRQLIQLKGVSIDKALAIVDKYPSPKLLKLAYAQSSEPQAEKLLTNVLFGKNYKKIGPVISKTIYQLYK